MDGLVVGRRLVFVERRSRAREQCPTVVPTEHAGEESDTVVRAFVDDLATFDDPDQSCVRDICHPHRAVGVEADAVRCDGDLAQRLGDIGRGRGITE